MDPTPATYNPKQLTDDFAKLLQVPAISRLYSDHHTTLEEVRAIGVIYANGLPISRKSVSRHVERPRMTYRLITSLLFDGLERTIERIETTAVKLERNAQKSRDLTQRDIDIEEIHALFTQPGEQKHGYDGKVFYERVVTGKTPARKTSDGYYPDSSN